MTTQPSPPVPIPPLKIRPIPGAMVGNIADSIQKALDTLKPGEFIAVVAHADLNDGRGAIVLRGPGGFSFMGWADKEWKGPWSAGAEIMFRR